jgi:LuxR family maltose regulon positive regulatory protein
VAELHRRASAWFAGHGATEEALRHALGADDFATAAHLVERQVHPLLNRERWRELERWLSLLPEAVVHQRPALLVARAVVYTIQDRPGAVPPLLREADALLDGAGSEPGVGGQSDVRGTIDTLRAQYFYDTNNSAEGIRVAERALAQLPPTAVYVRDAALAYLAMHQHLAGQGPAAIRMLEETIETEAASGVVMVRALMALCHIHRQDGNLDATAGAARRLLALAQQHDLPLGMTWARYFLGCVAYERQDLEVARARFLAVSEQRYFAHVMVVRDSLVGLALTYQAQGRATEAQEALRDLSEYAIESNHPVAHQAARALEARLALAVGELETAHALFAALDQPSSPPTPLLLLDPRPLIQVRILLAEGNAASLRQAGERLAVLRAFAASTHSEWHLYAIQALQALVADGLGRRGEALALLRQALLAAQPARFVRSFVDAGPGIEDLLREVRSREAPRQAGQGVAQVTATYLDRVLAACVSCPPSTAVAALHAPTAQGGPDDPLTEREIEVLGFLVQRYSDKEIAQELVISPSTVHTYTQSIYRKLEVNGRREAVARAKALGLLAS